MDFQKFLEDYKKKLSDIFSERKDAKDNTLIRGIEDDTLNEILDLSPLASFIPSEYGGYGGHTAEALSMLEASSYESLPLSLMMGINGALFLQPVANYATEDVKKRFMKGLSTLTSLAG